jgi:Mg2+ and Co2+ transporter CorA
LVAGLPGTNVGGLPGINVPAAFFIVIALMAVAGLAQYFYFNMERMVR